MPSDLQTQLAALAQRVSALEAGQASGQDSFAPNAFSYAADGSVQEILTGHLKATGIDLPAQAQGTPASLVQWLNQINQAAASISGWDDPPLLPGIEIDAYSTEGQGSQILMFAHGGGGEGFFELGLINNGVNVNQTELATQAPDGGRATIWAQGQQSRFVQSPDPTGFDPVWKRLVLNVYNITVQWGGGNSSTPYVNVGFSPPANDPPFAGAVWLATCENISGYLPYATVKATGDTSCDIAAVTPFGQPAAGVTEAVHAISVSFQS